MAALPSGGKLYALFTIAAHYPTVPDCVRPVEAEMIVGLAVAIFVALFGWGSSYFGWSDAGGEVQLALFTSFVLGALCGYRSRG